MLKKVEWTGVHNGMFNESQRISQQDSKLHRYKY